MTDSHYRTSLLSHNLAKVLALMALYLSLQGYGVYAQTAGPATPGTQPAVEQNLVFFKFLDAQSGAAVKPTALLLNGKPAEFTVEAGSMAAMKLPEGSHELAIVADDHTPMEVTISVAAGENPVMTFELDSATAETAAPIPPGVAVLTGHITDADTGALLNGVVLTMPEANLSTTTDVSGSYSFTVKVPVTTDVARPAISMEVRSEQHVPVRYRNLTLTSGEQRRMPIQLERLTSATQTLTAREVDEAAAGRSVRNFDWTFDVSVR